MTSGPRPFDLSTTPITSGITLVEASAGTGKTYSLTGLVLRLILEDHVGDVGKILVMTFTNAATAELVERIRGALSTAIDIFRGRAENPDDFLSGLAERHGEDGLRKLERAQRDLDDLEVCTIHGFCRRMLDQNAFETGSAFDVEYTADDGVLLTSAAEDFWRRTIYPAGDLVAAIAEHRKWTPSSFVDDYKVCRRHPRIEILPASLPLDDAIRALSDPVTSVRAAWDRGEIAEFLTTAKYGTKDGLSKAISAGERDACLTAADAFCAGGQASGLSGLLDLEPTTLDKRLLKASKSRYADTALARALPALGAAIDVLEHALRCAFIREIEAVFEDAKRAAGVAHYDDLLLRLHAALADPARAPALRRAATAQFQAVLVDEFQDTDTIQYEIFRGLFAEGQLFLVGDPKQAIYGFRGADVFAYMRAKADAGRAPYSLDTNFRSEMPLVKAVNALFAKAPRPFAFAEIPFVKAKAAGRADREPLTGDDRRALEWIWLEATSDKEAGAEHATSATVREIVRLLDREGGARIGDRLVEPRDIAVLVRSNKRADQVQAALRDAGVPAVVSQAGNVLESEEALELQTMLAAVAAPRDAGALRAALATRAFGYSATRIANLGVDEVAWQTLVDRFDELHATWARHGFVAMAEKLLAFADARARLLAVASGARRLTNLLHLVELTERAVEEHHLTPDGVVAWLARVRAEPKLFPEDAAEIRLETDAEAVQIATIHKSKGLEYAIVFCPFLWDVVEPKSDKPRLAHLDGDRVVLHYPPPSEDVEQASERERVSEEARLAYVALTRAKHRCYVVWGNVGSKSAQASALAHVLHEGAAPEMWREQLDAFCATHPTLMSVQTHDPDAPATRWEPPAAELPGLKERVFPPGALRQLAPWRVASFSSFRAPAPAAVSEIPDYGDPAAPPPVELTPPRGIFAFAKGARAGTCLHEIFETLDFARARDAKTKTLVAETLRSHGLAASTAHAGRIEPGDVVAEMLADVVASALPESDFTLAAVTRDRRLPEWQFHLPMGSVSQQRLADTFARHGRGPIREQYPTLLRALGDRSVEGFLMGFVDLVFVHDDRWYVVDWKSNHLGNDVSAYDGDALTRAMCEHHYMLQYHLYVLALHRYLGQRLRDYDYAKHFGGVYYGFLRGIRAGAAGGWYFDRPPRALVDALDDLIRGKAAA